MNRCDVWLRSILAAAGFCTATVWVVVDDYRRR